MSRVRLSNKPGDWLLEGPGFARTQGYGGSLVVTASTGPDREAVILRGAISRAAEVPKDMPKPKPKPRPVKPARIHLAGCIRFVNHRGDCRLAPVLCAHHMKIRKQPCARTTGHAGPHMSRYQMDRDNAWRRENFSRPAA